MILTPEDLDIDCVRIVDRCEAYSPEVASLLRVMLVIGCREGEVLDRARWVQLPSGSWELQPQKGNPVRTVPDADLPASFKAWLNGSGFPYRLSSLMNLRRVVDQFSAYPNATVGRKGISSHRFRHNRIKQLDLAGESIADIKRFMGLTATSTVRGYINSEIEA